MKKLIALVTVASFVLATDLIAGPGCCGSKAQAADAKKQTAACPVKDKAECKDKQVGCATACADTKAKGECTAQGQKGSVAKKNLKSPKAESVN